MIESEKFLTEKTAKVFEKLAKYDFLNRFTFVGGSALAYYLNHRLSEDLDFFSWDDSLPAEMNNFLAGLKKEQRLAIANSSNAYIDLFIDDVKVTFFANNWNALKDKRKKILENIYIADLDLLCAMKTNALSIRAKFRDYYDLYILNTDKYNVSEMLEFSLKYVPGMTKKIFSMHITYTEDIEDENIAHLSPKLNISLGSIQQHFENEIRKIL